MKKVLLYQILSTIGIVVVALLGSVFVGLGMTWFNGLLKPTQWLPNFVIPVVWTIIYLLEIITLWILIGRKKMSKDLAVWFVINGILNVLWCLVFFALKLAFIGNVVIVLNLVAGFLLFVKLQKSNLLVSKLMLIYPLWLSIATTLNLALWVLN